MAALLRTVSATSEVSVRSLFLVAAGAAGACAYELGAGSPPPAFGLAGAAPRFSGAPISDEHVSLSLRRKEGRRRFMIINELGIYEDYEHFMRDGSKWWQEE